MSRRQEEKHRKRDRPQDEPEEPENGARGGDDELDVAPTDFGRNVWLLVAILAVVALAWLANVIADLGLFQPSAP